MLQQAAARSSRRFRRSSARNQSSAVVRAIWQSHVRALPRRASKRRQERSAFWNICRDRVLGERAVAGQIDEIRIHVVEMLLCGRGKRGRQGQLAPCGKRHRLHTVPTPPDGGSSHLLRGLEELLPALEQALQLLARRRVRGEDCRRRPSPRPGGARGRRARARAPGSKTRRARARSGGAASASAGFGFSLRSFSFGASGASSPARIRA